MWEPTRTTREYPTNGSHMLSVEIFTRVNGCSGPVQVGNMALPTDLATRGVMLGLRTEAAWVLSPQSLPAPDVTLAAFLVVYIL